MSKSPSNILSTSSQTRGEKPFSPEKEALTCFFCKIQPAKFFDSPTFMTYCISCASQLDTSSFTNLESTSVRSRIQDTVLSLFNTHRKSLCPERRKWIMQTLSKPSKDVLEVYHWLNTYVSNAFKCVSHPWIDAETIDLGKMALFCAFCSRDYPDLLRIDGNFHTAVQEAAIQVIGVSDIGILNKFILKYMQTREISNLNNLIIEVRDIIYNTSGVQISADSRCQSCLKKLGFGNKTPIRLPCENLMHVVCYECLTALPYICCSLDSKLYNSNYKFENFVQKYDFPLCCIGNCFFNTKNKRPYKLPCYHYTCQECKNLAESQNINFQCKTCDFRADLKNTKLDQKVMQNLTFVEVNCEDHNEPAVTFSSYGIKFYCEKCTRNSKRIPCKATRSLKLIEDVLERAFSLIYEVLPLSKSAYPASLRSKVNDFKMLSFQEKIKALALMSLSANNFGMIFDIKDTIESLKLGSPRSSYYITKKRIERFREIYPLYRHSLKSWIVEENQANAIALKTTQFTVLYGLLIGGRVDSQEAIIKEISITKSKKIRTGLISLFEHHYFKNICDKVNEISFPSEIVLEPNTDYTISVMLTPGRYFNGKPASMNYLVDESNAVLLEISEPIYEMPFRYGGNNRIGGPILGFIFATFE